MKKEKGKNRFFPFSWNGFRVAYFSSMNFFRFMNEPAVIR